MRRGSGNDCPAPGSEAVAADVRDLERPMVRFSGFDRLSSEMSIFA